MLPFFMVKVRLARFGKKRKPFFRIVISDSRKKREGEYIEKIGTYDPTKPALGTGIEKLKQRSSIDLPKYQEWIYKGAIPTNIVEKISNAHNQIDFAETIDEINTQEQLTVTL